MCVAGKLCAEPRRELCEAPAGFYFRIESILSFPEPTAAKYRKTKL